MLHWRGATAAFLNFADEGLLSAHDYGVACLMAFGYRKKEPRPKTRRPAELVIQWTR